MKINEEYLLFDNNGMIGSIGGTLGLFVGFSFLNIVTLLVDFLKKLIVKNEVGQGSIEKGLTPFQLEQVRTEVQKIISAKQSMKLDYM